MPSTTQAVRDEFEAAAQVGVKHWPALKRYNSPENVAKIVQRMLTYGLTVASMTMVERSISELVAEGKIKRVDGGSAETDRIAAEKARQDRIAQQAAAPLTTADWERFSQMSQAEVQRLFYSDELFAARYRKAAEKWGFIIPEKPAAEAEVSAGQWDNLDARAYFQMPASQIVRLYKADKSFKLAVDKLIREGKI